MVSGDVWFLWSKLLLKASSPIKIPNNVAFHLHPLPIRWFFLREEWSCLAAGDNWRCPFLLLNIFFKNLLFLRDNNYILVRILDSRHEEGLPEDLHAFGGMLKLNRTTPSWSGRNITIQAYSCLTGCWRGPPISQEQDEELAAFPAACSMVKSIRDSFQTNRRGICHFRNRLAPEWDALWDSYNLYLLPNSLS